MLFFTLFVAAALLGLTNAQGNYTIDPSSVPINTRDSWCSSQESACPLLCLQLPAGSSSTAINTCNSTTLTYSCICGNGMSPNASQYSETLPFFICQEWGTQCVEACGNNNTCQSACTQDHPCGAQKPTRVTVTSSTVSATAAATSSNAAGVVYNGPAASTSTGTSSGAQPALGLGQSSGLAIVVGGLLASFTLLL